MPERAPCKLTNRNSQTELRRSRVARVFALPDYTRNEGWLPVELALSRSLAPSAVLWHSKHCNFIYQQNIWSAWQDEFPLRR